MRFCDGCRLTSARLSSNVYRGVPLIFRPRRARYPGARWGHPLPGEFIPRRLSQSQIARAVIVGIGPPNVNTRNPD